MSYQFTENLVQVNDNSVFYLEGGIKSSADPILFIHGWSVGIAPYQEAINILGQRYHVIAPTLPGLGKSSDANMTWNYNRYALFIIDFIKTLNLKKVHLIGHSLGGGISATVAALMPSLVSSITLVDSTGVPTEPLPVVMFQRLIEMTGQMPQMKFPQVGQIFQSFSYNLFFNTENTVKTLWVALEDDLRPILPQIEAPCLILWAANDLTTPLSAGREFSQLIKNSRLVVVEDVYHEWNIFFTQKFVAIVFEFLEAI